MLVFKVLRVKNQNLYLTSNIYRKYVTVKPNIICNNTLFKRNGTIQHNLQSITSCRYSASVKNNLINKFAESDTIVATNAIPYNTNNIVDNSSKFEETIVKDENVVTADELEQIKKLYLFPKVTLNNIYTIVANELKSTGYKVQPHFKTSPQRPKQKGLNPWICTYHVKWPEDHKFSATSNSKADASNKAAIQVLVWLNKKKRISRTGVPLIYDKSELNAITTNTSIPLLLNTKEEETLNEINNEFQVNLSSKMLHKYENGSDVEFGNKSVSESWSEYGEETSRKPKRNKFRNLDSLKAKESVPLPIANHRKEIEELISNNRVVVIKGEPGCGKSTRVPQYVLEQWVHENGDDACKIVVTQPRRIAAISLAERVANERKEHVGDVVGFQVRLSSNFNPNTGRILFCTTGILLRRLQADPKLQDCTHIVLDEAHERDVNTDLLMNLLRHALKLNSNLKLIIMSATIDTGLFQNYFTNSDGTPTPAIHIPGFTYPVKVHYLDDMQIDLPTTRSISSTDSPIVHCEEVAQLIKWIHKSKPEGAILCFLPGWEEISRLKRYLQGSRQSRDWAVLALHSRLPDTDQRKIFSRPPPGIRKIILATNIAETSVTIDDVVYVIDSGIHKEERYNVSKGIMSIDNHWISQSSMRQRKGRAGRCRSGESFHLYPEYKYNQMSKYSIPEILRTSLTKIVLDSKVYSNNMNAIEFLGHLPNPPQNAVIKQAVQELKELELLDENENLTSLGKTLSEFQMAPKLSRAMVNSVIFKCVSPIVDIATLYSNTSELFSTAMIDKEGVRNVKQKFCPTSDHVAMMKLFETWYQFMLQDESEEAELFCKEFRLGFYKLRTIEKLREIHFEYLYKGLKNVVKVSDDYSDNEEFVKGVLLSGVGSFLQLRKWDIVKGRLKKSQVFVTKKGQKATLTSDSVNHGFKGVEDTFLVHINETRSEIRRTSLIRETSQVSPLTLLLFKNETLYIKEVNDSKFKQNYEDPVFLRLANTKVTFLCERRQALSIINCKDALTAGLHYYIYQLTDNGEKDSSINKSWETILQLVSDLLSNVSNNSELIQ